MGHRGAASVSGRVSTTQPYPRSPQWPLTGLPPASAGHALPLAGNDPAANRIVDDLHDTFGFDVLNTRPLAQSWRCERAKLACCIPLDMDALHRALDAATGGGELPHGSWLH